MLETIDVTPLSQQPTDWSAIFADENAWRGDCMHHCSAVEMAVTETLVALSSVKAGGQTVGLRHLIGQRLEDLTAAVGPDGPFGEVGKAALAELLQYRERHEEFRKQLCHGVLKVAVERSGQWTLVICMLAIRAGGAERTALPLNRAQALATLDALKRDGTRLTSVLGNLRKTVSC